MAFSNIIQSKLNYHDKTLIENIEFSKKELEKLLQIEGHIELGGGLKNIEKQHKKGRLTARERINLLIDQDSPFMELSKLAAYGLYKEYGGAPSAGTITALAYIEGRVTMVIANDATVKAGAFFPMTGKGTTILHKSICLQLICIVLMFKNLTIFHRQKTFYGSVTNPIDRSL